MAVAPPRSSRNRNRMEYPVLDIVFIVGILALVALVALVGKGVEKL